MGPCAKQRVTAVVSHNHPDHDPQAVIIGENVCLTPRSLCPRMPGEGYAKCYTHCAQLGHAEEVALRVVRHLGIPFENITDITVYGHHGPCDNCRSMLAAYGLLDVTHFKPGVKVRALTTSTQSDISEAYNLNNPSSHSKHAAADDVAQQRTEGNDAQGAKGTGD